MLAVDENHKYVKVDGLWYFVTLCKVPGAEETVRPFDVVLKQTAFAEAFIGSKAYRYNNRFLQVWGGPFYASAKRQANSREIRRIVAALAEGEKVLTGDRDEQSGKHFVRQQRTRR
jgi:hypothetical protein